MEYLYKLPASPRAFAGSIVGRATFSCVRAATQDKMEDEPYRGGTVETKKVDAGLRTASCK